MNSSIDIRTLRKQSARKASSGQSKSQQKGFWEFLNRDIAFGAAIPDKVKEGFYLELGTLLEAGIDIRTAIELIADNQSKEKFRKYFQEVLQQIVSGSTFSAALKELGKFSKYEYLSVQIGEETGKLIIVLKELAIYFQKKIKQRRQVIGALTYPAIVLLVAFGAIFFMVTYVVPMFSDVFKRFGGDLPLATKIVVRISGIAKHYFWFIVLFTCFFIALVLLQRKKRWFRSFGWRVVKQIPVIGDLIKKIYLARFSQILSLLIGSKVPIVQALDMSREMIGFFPIEDSLPDIEQQILHGTSLNKALSMHEIYPRKMTAMLKVGEDVNQLEKFFGKITDQYSDDVEYQTNLLSKFVEPMIIIFLGLVVGTILIAMYLPLFKLGQAF